MRPDEKFGDMVLVLLPLDAERSGLGDPARRGRQCDRGSNVFTPRRQTGHAFENRRECFYCKKGMIGGDPNIIGDHAGVGGKCRRFARKRPQVRNLPLKIGGLQSNPADTKIDMLIQRSEVPG